jgi:hypothetical protein
VLANDSDDTEALSELPDLGPELFESRADDRPISPDARPPTNAIEPEPDDEEIFIVRKRVVDVERELSQLKYDTADWDLGQTLRWFAYRNQMNFRSLSAADLNPPPTYYGKNYAPVYAVKDPARALKDALLGPSLKCRRAGTEVAPTEWLEMEIWDCPDIKFLRADVLRCRKKIDVSVVRPPKKHVSDANATDMYRQLEKAIGREPGLHSFYKVAKGQGVTSTQAKKIWSGACSTARDRGRKKGPTEAPKIPG